MGKLKDLTIDATPMGFKLVTDPLPPTPQVGELMAYSRPDGYKCGVLTLVNEAGGNVSVKVDRGSVSTTLSELATYMHITFWTGELPNVRIWLLGEERLWMNATIVRLEDADVITLNYDARIRPLFGAP